MPHPHETTAYLHIGAPKCGSSALQEVLDANAETLRAAGFALPASAAAAADIAHAYTRGWREAPAGRPEIPTGGAPLLSCEAFLALPQTPEAHARFLRDLGCRHLRVLAVVRRPSALLESTWFQWIRTYRRYPKVAASLRHHGLHFRDYLTNGWFAAMDRNWRAWVEHPRTELAMTLRPESLATLAPAARLSEFLGLSEDLAEPERAVNASINGVTFLLLRELRKEPIEAYQRFVARLDRRLAKEGYGAHRFLSERAAALIDRAAATAPLFASYTEPPEPRPAAQDLTAQDRTRLRSLARELLEAHRTEHRPAAAS